MWTKWPKKGVTRTLSGSGGRGDEQILAKICIPRPNLGASDPGEKYLESRNGRPRPKLGALGLRWPDKGGRSSLDFGRGLGLGAWEGSGPKKAHQSGLVTVICVCNAD